MPFGLLVTALNVPDSCIIFTPVPETVSAVFAAGVVPIPSPVEVKVAILLPEILIPTDVLVG
jgi:hypothetical protein